ncbi:MAG: type VI immunity family protein [Acetobacteraceae bacterium]
MATKGKTIIYARRGEVRACLTIGFTLFFTAQDFDAQLWSALETAVALVAPNATWYRATGMRRNRATEQKVLRQELERLGARAKDGEDCALIIDSGETLDGVADWALKFSHEPRLSDHFLGYIQVHTPVADQDRRAAQIFQLMECSVNRARFLHGSAGYSVNFDHGDLDRERDIAIRAFCERYLGVALSDLVTEREQLRDGIKGGQWVLFLGESLLSRHQNETNVLTARPGAARGPHGLLIRACDEPILGDQHRSESIEPYREVSGAVRPWLVDSLFPMPGFPDEQSVRVWLQKLRPSTT